MNSNGVTIFIDKGLVIAIPNEAYLGNSLLARDCPGYELMKDGDQKRIEEAMKKQWAAIYIVDYGHEPRPGDEHLTYRKHYPVATIKHFWTVPIAILPFLARVFLVTQDIPEYTIM